MSRSIPSVKTWQIKFYRKHSRPYEIIRVDAPTKYLAKLNCIFDKGNIGAQWWKALSNHPDRITYGISRD